MTAYFVVFTVMKSLVIFGRVELVVFWCGSVVLGLCAGMGLSAVIYLLPQRLHYRWLVASDQISPKDKRNYAYHLSLRGWLSVSCRGCLAVWYEASADKLPLLYFILGKGRCGGCRRKISFIPPFIETLTTLVTVLACWQHASLNAIALTLLLSYILIMLMIIDFQRFILPDDLTLTLLWLGLLVNIDGHFATLSDAVVGGAVGYLSLWCLYWLMKWLSAKEGLGYGDFKLFAALGACFGWQWLDKIAFGASLLGLLHFLTIFLRRGKAAVAEPLPLGSYLCVTALLMLFYPALSIAS
jgi:leader peptidase (prepilin peptidase)/N-methyltransferase